ncbi:hypothetical protein LOTGIDRAFT_238064 [Lottia gigantea]|uniref:Homeobox domain-containing protein n=1 Tax=Lottia gigantea TaxID=225164 RepID=V4B459_LOTGI|nr:hypothetical protein LOTGIDRAFT_238064 [Lottia gigantea]ESP02236.1 hypothetical protein LOTGIDRAFT_238064 [Lottia gigantea]
MRRLFPEKIHHKRQTLQDMARPLKRWLYENRDNPYPTKEQKHSLAVNSHMSLVQISNWFANARRRLKNVVKKPELSWSERVELYNQYVEGDAELFSISSEDEDFDEDEDVQNDDETFQNENTLVISHTDLNQSDSLVPSRTTTPTFDQRSTVFASTTSLKHKQTILQRYFNDNAYIDAMGFHPPSEGDPQRVINVAELVWNRRDRHQSGSLGSQDYEEMSTSSASSRIQHRILDDFPEEQELPTYRITQHHSFHDDSDMRQKEMDAVFALTSLANSHRSKLQENVTPERSNFRM